MSVPDRTSTRTVGRSSPHSVGLTQSLLFVAVAACGGAETQSAPVHAASASIVIDGRLDDWPDGTSAVADGRHLYLRVDLPDEITIQGGQVTTTVELDLDGKPDTGRDQKAGRLRGADLEIVFSPKSPEADKGLRPGVAVRMIDDRSVTTEVGHAAIGLLAAPTVATRAVELRIDRDVRLPEPAGSRYRASRLARFRVTVEDAGGAPLLATDPVAVRLPDLAPRSPADVDLPVRPRGSVRVVSWNVEWDSPIENPAPFSRILRALGPDVVLVQEWRSSDAELEAWFSAEVPSETAWSAHPVADLGVAVVSRLPSSPLLDQPLVPARAVAGKPKRPVRFAAARVQTPFGPIVAGSAHLKCCGSKGTWEDELRRAEAEAIRDWLRRELVSQPETPCVLTGDMNLVGTRLPLDALRETLDTDGSDLDVVEAGVLGDAVAYTWTKDDARFAPGRLDYAVVSGASLAVRNAFVLDTALLSDASLRRNGLERSDSAASDHRPLVLDIQPRQTP